jgi:hypothetical protein
MESPSPRDDVENQGRLELEEREGSLSADGRSTPDTPSDSFQSSFVKKFGLPTLYRANTIQRLLAPGDPVKETIIQRLRGLFIDWWLFEIFCCIFSAGCFIAIAIVLTDWNNKPLPATWPLNITLTTRIAILAAFAKYALVMPLQVCIGQLKWTWFQTGRSHQLLDLELYDQATRGPIGAAALVVHTKGR